jgi:hypothetical protein
MMPFQYFNPSKNSHFDEGTGFGELIQHRQLKPKKH